MDKTNNNDPWNKTKHIPSKDITMYITVQKIIVNRQPYF